MNAALISTLLLLGCLEPEATPEPAAGKGAGSRIVPLTTQEHAPAKERVAPRDLTPSELQAARVFADVVPSVVGIRTSSERVSADGSRGVSQGIGTGVLISAECHILTAAHVVDGASEIFARLDGGSERRADVLFSEPAADIALLKLTDPDPTLPHATLGDSDHLAVGQNLYVIGNPRGLDNTFTSGVLSGFRDFASLYDGSILVEFIQTDAPINSGNSGGPVVDGHGRVVGIASRISTQGGGSEGLGFAVAINSAKKLLALEDRVWLGLQATFMTREELALLFHLDLPGGLLVQTVDPNGPAHAAGIRAGRIPSRIGRREIMLGGDLIVQFGGQEACHSTCLAEAGQALRDAKEVSVHFLRNGRVETTLLDVSESRRNFLDLD